ncbi:hypothetical protein BOW53_16075 [Solemya pervernicosa gill symbiont]|uniref:histidine kinase n=1 Tax=Solemya pervernicosa gill symbiont TaxID=642797 RepID=A0A1T2KZM3_9GAMM|nr:ATP-binding protein [Solemya pervernicosa gill symbiont]OOZ38271.1 hypothetical protein BOW53_16075 [Solemya pervernicosa gill symbiont]
MDIIEQGLAVENFETTIHCKNGSERVLSWNSHDLKDADGEVIGSLALAKDITDMHHSQEELKHALQQAESASKAKDQFIAATSHKIRTPITAILGIIDLLAKTELSDKQREHLDVARTATNILSTTMEDVLDVARLKGGQYQLDEREEALSSSLEDIATILGNDARNKGLAFHAEIGSELPERIIVDHARLHQILMNLGYNAIKFTEQGAVTLRAHLDEERPDVLRLTVSDTGIGIPDEKITSIFEPYEQADNSMSRKHGGLGLGLAIVAQLIDLMGGDIEVSSVIDVGTIITVELPFTVGASEHNGEAETDSASKGGEQRSLRILLAEDNHLNVIVITSFFDEMPHALEVAVNGRKAVEHYQEEHYDLVLMDIQMPELDGNSAMQQIRVIEQDEGRNASHIIALTAADRHG